MSINRIALADSGLRLLHQIRVFGCVMAAAATIAATATVASAQESGRWLDDEEAVRIMKDLKRKADAERARDAQPTATSPADDASGWSSDDRRPLSERVDPESAALREREAEEVLDTIRRARAARDAFDDPDPVLEALPDHPPGPRRVAEPSQPRGSGVLAPPAGRFGLGGRLAEPEPAHDASASRYVTILLEMDVGRNGIRRWSKTADPMLCLHEYCFLSRGPSKSAIRYKRRVAFGPGIALGQRGLACRSSPECVFRNVDLGAVEARLQPIDLKFLRHDRRQPELVRADTTCSIQKGKLTCAQPVKGGTWRAWIVPETVAELAGTERLEKALREGLESPESLEARR